MDSMRKPDSCVFCGKDESFGPMNVENFVMKALWDGTRPAGTKTVPAHKDCNSEFSEDVDLFRDILALSAHANQHPEVQKLLRGKLQRKIEKRGRSMEAKLKPIILPNTTESGLYLGHTLFMQVDPQLVVRVVRNVARGLYYSETGNLVPLSVVIAVIYLDNSNVHVVQLRDLVCSLGKTESFGDDVFRYKREFEPGAMACALDFYNSHRFLCHAMWDEETPAAGKSMAS